MIELIEIESITEYGLSPILTKIEIGIEMDIEIDVEIDIEIDVEINRNQSNLEIRICLGTGSRIG